MEHWTNEKHKTLIAKKPKCNYAKSDSLDNEAESTFPIFIIIESSSLLITNLFPFIIEKVISGNLTPISVKKNLKMEHYSLKWKSRNV